MAKRAITLTVAEGIRALPPERETRRITTRGCCVGIRGRHEGSNCAVAVRARRQTASRDASIIRALRPMHAIVTNVEVKTLPFTSDDNGEPWDLFSGPDLHYEAYGPGDECLHASDVANDIRPRDLPVALGGEFAVESPDRHVLRLLDADLTGQEVLARLAEEGLEGAPQRRLGGGMEPAICLAPVLGEMPITAPKHHERVFSPASAASRSAAVSSVRRESIHLGALPHGTGLGARLGWT